jgi:GxxExxY protein
MKTMSLTENEISYRVRSAIFKVYSFLGPGLLESAYQAALKYELEKLDLLVQAEVAVPLMYEGIHLDVGYRIDLLVNNKVIIEIKSVENLAPVHHKQVLTYLKLAGIKLGLLINFNTDDILKSIFRKVNGL